MLIKNSYTIINIIFKIHKIYSNMYSYTLKCNRPNEPNFFMVFYEDELEEIDDE